MQAERIERVDGSGIVLGDWKAMTRAVRTVRAAQVIIIP
jgi:hypothetical protein